MKDISTSTFNFERLVSNGFLYVDKTAYVHKLARPAFAEYFLSRPRRFGKSLLVSTLKALFQGRRELFKGLAIDKMDYDWRQYPVIHLDFGACMASTKEELEDFLRRRLAECAAEHEIMLEATNSQELFIELIIKLARGAQVVVLVDEYDKPILGNIDNKGHRDGILSVLKGFYGVIKTYEGLIRFAFITGVSKFSYVSLFSDLNNLTDITLSPEYAGMLGFTEAEIREYFADRIPLAAKARGKTGEQVVADILRWYDGYRFSAAGTHVCNPVSLSKFFSNDYVLDNYWDDTGTPGFLVRLSRDRGYDYEAALDEWYGRGVFSAYDLDRLDITGLLWQTGYLTIRDVRQGRRGLQYRLGFPDKEVADTFSMRLLEFYGNLPNGTGDTLVDSFADAIAADDLPGFMKLFQSFLANIPYGIHLPYEKYYQTIFFSVFKLIGASIDAESCTNEGRIDAYIRTAGKVYIFEFKLDGAAGEAVGQIIDRRYYEKFQGAGLPIVMVGVNFDSGKGRIDGWTVLDA